MSCRIPQYLFNHETTIYLTPPPPATFKQSSNQDVFPKHALLDYSNYALGRNKNAHQLVSGGVTIFGHNCALHSWKNIRFWNLCYEISAAFSLVTMNLPSSSSKSGFSWQIPLLLVVGMLRCRGGVVLWPRAYTETQRTNMGITSPLILSLSLEMCPLDTTTNSRTSFRGFSAFWRQGFFSSKAAVIY